LEAGALALRLAGQAKNLEHDAEKWVPVFGKHHAPKMMLPDARAQRDAFLRKVAAPPTIMGILNLTPDSFSDGGRFANVDAAVAHAAAMAAAGADVIDLGGESTRPEAVAVSATEELARIEPVLARLATELAVPISIDTYKAQVAARAAALGAVVINDVWGLQKDPAMADAVAAAETALIIVHNRAEKDAGVDIVAEMERFFDRSLALAAKAGIPRERIILDPGIGFAKTSAQNRAAFAHIAKLKERGLPILVGVSRKRFLGSDAPALQTLPGTIAANLAAAALGATVFRVHDVAEHAAALKAFHALRRGRKNTTKQINTS
jgi:dihydropteroate synthase